MSESVQSNSAVLVHFTLKLDDGTTAESTRNNGKPALFRPSGPPFLPRPFPARRSRQPT